MLLTPANLNIFFTATDQRYNQAYQQAESWAQMISTAYPNSTEQWLQGWLGQFDKLREWIGPRTVHVPAPSTYIATVKIFEYTIGIDKFKLQFDQYGIYSDFATRIGYRARKWPDYNLRDLIEASGDYTAAALQLGTDGVNHWSAVHPVDVWDAGKGTYVNDYGAAGTSINGITVGGTFSTNAWATMYTDHSSRRDESGEKMSILADQTMVPLQLHWEAKTVIQQGFFSPAQIGTLGGGLAPTAGVATPANTAMVGALDNPFKGSTDLMMNPDLASVAAFYLLTTKGPVKPFGFVQNQAPVIIPRSSPTDPAMFDNRTMLWGVEAVGVAVWAPPFLSSRSGI